MAGTERPGAVKPEPDGRPPEISSPASPPASQLGPAAPVDRASASPEAEPPEREDPVTAALDGREIMMAVAADQQGAFEVLVSTYEGRVKATVRRFIMDRAAVDDLAQEVFLRLFRSRQRYQPTAKFETFLHRVIFNTCVNYTQYRNRRKALSLDAPTRDEDGPSIVPPDENMATPLRELELTERAAFVRRAVERLPETQRRALLLSRFEGMSYEEIGEVMELTLQAVKSLLWRARDNVRQQLLPILGDDTDE